MSDGGGGCRVCLNIDKKLEFGLTQVHSYCTVESGSPEVHRRNQQRAKNTFNPVEIVNFNHYYY